uniref:Uncharacterized protein n=1 Tax=viral metagenome TaxID=1070528 RepID=A0A6C0EJU8_9ZZZZ
MNKTFYAMNMHGYESKEDCVIPENCRVIMFCYSGKLLHICPRFDRYNWGKIFTDPGATKDYQSFLKVLSGYSSLRDHFCVYEPGSVIKEIDFHPDEYFRHGLFRLPVRAAVCVEKDNRVYITDVNTAAKYLTMPEKPLKKCRNVVLNAEKASNALPYLENTAWVDSTFIMHASKLSNILRGLKFKYGGVTLLLLTCREGKGYNLNPAPTVGESL